MKKKIFTLLTLLVACVTGAWATDVTFGYSEGNISISTMRSDGKDGAPTSVSSADGKITFAIFNGPSSGNVTQNSSKLKFQNTTYMTISSASGYTISKIVITTSESNRQFTASEGSFSRDGGVSTWTGSSSSVTFTNNTENNLNVTSVVVTYATSSGKTSLTGAWSDAAPSFSVGSAATIPTFSVKGGGTLGTDYTVAYTKTDASGIVTLTDGTGAISAISTAAAATATVTATVTIVNTTTYEMATTSYDCAISVIATTPYSAPNITEKNGTVQITPPDDGVVVSQIKYSLDNGETWNTYSIPFNLATTTTVKAKVVTGADPSKTDSEVASEVCDAIPAAVAGSLSITLYNDDSNWTKSESIESSGINDTWTGKADTYLEGYSIVLDNVGKEGKEIKELSYGSAINSKSTIKGSNGRKLTFTLPAGIKVNRITVYSYTNGDDDNFYASQWKFNGSAADMIGLSLRDVARNDGKSKCNASNPDVRVFSFATPLESSFEFVNTGYQQCFYMVLDYTQTVAVTIASSGYSTLASGYALDCANLPSGLKAYKVSGISKSAVTLEEVTTAVAASTGLILEGTASTAYTIPVAASGTDISASNYLKAAVTATTLADGSFYILQGGKFCLVTGAADEAARTVPAGKAYLLASDVPVSAPGYLGFDFGGGTNISTTNFTNDTNNSGEFYNLAGQRVAQPTKGLYIVNGRKVVIK